MPSPDPDVRPNLRTEVAEVLDRILAPLANIATSWNAKVLDSLIESARAHLELGSCDFSDRCPGNQVINWITAEDYGPAAPDPIVPPVNFVGDEASEPANTPRRRAKK